ncbi:MAG: hypothetical protein IKJ39_08370 [Lachnospiraceae bacterium]|nr:hypothetical protein [Lachnospiraceae bacterium]
MGLDIYAGTLSRYYMRNWKTITQQFCEANGMQYTQIHPTGQEENEGSASETEEVVKLWQEQMVNALKSAGAESAKEWQDDWDTKPYYTHKPDWDAYGALLLYATGKLLKVRSPKDYKKNTDYHAVLKVMGIYGTSYRQWSLFNNVCHYVPIADRLVFKYPLPDGRESMLSTVACLKYELEKINEACWQADEATILDWINTEGYPVEGQITGTGLLRYLPKRNIYSTESLAKFAFSILWQAVCFAEKEQVAIVLDF